MQGNRGAESGPPPPPKAGRRCRLRRVRNSAVARVDGAPARHPAAEKDRESAKPRDKTADKDAGGLRRRRAGREEGVLRRYVKYYKSVPILTIAPGATN